MMEILCIGSLMGDVVVAILFYLRSTGKSLSWGFFYSVLAGVTGVARDET
jgi:hypothetical protein